MTKNIEEWTGKVSTGDARDVLSDMPSGSVHCVICSPPYYQLRDYGEIKSIWGGSETCNHTWQTEKTSTQGGQNVENNPPDVGGNQHNQDGRLRGGDDIESNRCTKCGAWHGQLGLEPSLDQYIRNIVSVGSEIKRVLREDGVWWLNMGDTFNSGGSNNNSTSPNVGGPSEESATSGTDATYQRKQKMLVPYRVAISLQQDGWILRNDCTWYKQNPMPSSVKDRLNTSTERMFLLSQNQDYYFDLDAIREQYSEGTKKRVSQNDWEPNFDGDKRRGHPREDAETLNPDQFVHPSGKNPGDVFEVSTQPFSDAHFAVYPPSLIRKPIKSGCPVKVCSDCSSPYERDKIEADREYERGNEEWRSEANLSNPQRDHDGDWRYEAEFLGWKQTCDCSTDETNPGIVLDPFIGSGTTALVAEEQNRRWAGIDLNAEYVEMAEERLRDEAQYTEQDALEVDW